MKLKQTGMSKLFGALSQTYNRARSVLTMTVCFGKRVADAPGNAVIFFPYSENVLCCGLSGIVSVRTKNKTAMPDPDFLAGLADKIEKGADKTSISEYLGGKETVDDLWKEVCLLKRDQPFIHIYTNRDFREELSNLAERIRRIVANEGSRLAENMGLLETGQVEAMSERIEKLKDIAWCLTVEIDANIEKTKDLLSLYDGEPQPSTIESAKKINAVLNSIDRLEVRGRDSAGISLMFVLEQNDFDAFIRELDKAGLMDELKERTGDEILVNRSVRIHPSGSGNETAIALVYKIAAEIGSLGDNIGFLREQIKTDRIFQLVARFSFRHHTVASHTRWASVGAITGPNCHPVDNFSKCAEATVKTLSENGFHSEGEGIIHVSLNGDIDNYQELLDDFRREGNEIHPDITTDTKIIPIQTEKYLRKGFEIGEAFRMAVNDFEGSHAVSMHTDIAPGKLFLAQKGSGQAVFVGLAADHYMPASEVYGFVEETQSYLKLDGESVFEGKNGKTQGQIFVLNQNSSGGLAGVTAMYYDGTPIELGTEDVKHTEITSRDIDRQDFPHYFLKEISESPNSVEKTLQNRWKVEDGDPDRYMVALGEDVIPGYLAEALAQDRIRRIFFIGQGTAGISAHASAQIMKYYINDTRLQIESVKASEMSGFVIPEEDDAGSMKDTLVVAVSQSGTTTDTNKTVDMVRERGAYTLAIVNRRDSDITFKVDGVLYTSSGRDIEMSVASTKAFYSQIVAGAVLGLYIAGIKNRRSGSFISKEIKKMLKLPSQMRKILEMKSEIEASARRLCPTRTYWAAVGSGPNKASADEIRIKLSELCYKTISTDYVEDKKHIDLSSEPLIIICAAGTRETVIGDIIKDTAIFHAHKAAPVVIASEGENRFAAYAEDVFHVPAVDEHLAPIVNTLAGHIWGYYAALAINEGSRFLHRFREETQDIIDRHAQNGISIYETVLQKDFREKIVAFYHEFRRIKKENRFPASVIGSSDLILLLKYLAGRLPVSDFELDFGRKGTATDMLDTFFRCLGEMINRMSRPVDAIKHQAKTVTVGTSRVREKVDGILFEALYEYNIKISQLTASNVIVIKNLQGIVSDVRGSLFYKVSGLDLLGEPTDDTLIELVSKEGITASIASRVENDNRLKGTKRIIVREGNVYVGAGLKDKRSVIIIPISSASPSTNAIEHLLLLHVKFKKEIPLADKIRALGGKYEKIKNFVMEANIVWDDTYLERIQTGELFGISGIMVAESIIGSQGN